MTLPLVRIENWLPGEEVISDNLQDLASWARMKDAMVAHALAGTNAFLPSGNTGGIACVPGTGLQVLLQQFGTATCRAFLPHRPNDGTWSSIGNGQGSNLAQCAYYTPPSGGYPITLATPPPNSTPYRTDLICVQFTAVPVNPHQVNVRSGTIVSPQTCYQVEDTMAFTYVPGTPSGTFPAPTPLVPNGFNALYTVYVHHGDTSVATSAITLVMPTFDQLVAAMGQVVLSTAGFPCPPVGAQFVVTSNNAPVIGGGYYFILGARDFHGIIAVLNSVAGNQLTFTCLSIVFGTVGVGLVPGALITPIVQPLLYMQDGNQLAGSVIEWAGFIPDPGAAGTSTPVVFPQAFSDVSHYRFLGITPVIVGQPFTAYPTSKTADGFTIVIPAGGGHGPVDWAIRGRQSP